MSTGGGNLSPTPLFPLARFADLSGLGASANRVAQTRCPPGAYCERGVARRCPAGTHGWQWGLQSPGEQARSQPRFKGQRLGMAFMWLAIRHPCGFCTQKCCAIVRFQPATAPVARATTAPTVLSAGGSFHARQGGGAAREAAATAAGGSASLATSAPRRARPQHSTPAAARRCSARSAAVPRPT